MEPKGFSDPLDFLGVHCFLYLKRLFCLESNCDFKNVYYDYNCVWLGFNKNSVDFRRIVL